MSFTVSVNPFKDILCVPFYHIWILVVMSWILFLLEGLYHYIIDRLIAKQLKKLSLLNIQSTVNNAIRKRFKIELEKIAINGRTLPKEIVSIIMDMIPTTHDNWEEYSQSYQDSIYRKKFVLNITRFIYSTIRFIANMINFIIIIIQYVNWYNEKGIYLSHWRRYCAFIIANFYMPIWKGRGIMTMFVAANLVYNHPTECIYIFETATDAAFIIWFILIAVPFFGAGIFLFMPSLFLIMAFMSLISFIWFVAFSLFKQCYHAVFGRDPKEYFVGTVMALTSSLMWFCVLIVICIMEFFDGQSWTNSYRIGFYGEYCNGNDHFQVNKWNEYSVDIQFLIISWLLF